MSTVVSNELRTLGRGIKHLIVSTGRPHFIFSVSVVTLRQRLLLQTNISGHLLKDWGAVALHCKSLYRGVSFRATDNLSLLELQIQVSSLRSSCKGLCLNSPVSFPRKY